MYNDSILPSEREQTASVRMTLRLMLYREKIAVYCDYWHTECVFLIRLAIFLILFHSYAYENNQQDALYRLIYYSKSALHVSGDVFTHHQEHLTVFTVSGSVHPSCCRHQPAATCVNTIRYCKYSQALLMMGENIARNM